jgi:hypothetical protein
METFKIIIDIAEEYWKWKWCYKTSTTWKDQMVCMFLKTHLMILVFYINMTY